VVVGGGLAGLAAALECADGGAEVTLLEARPRLGGATFSIHRDGMWMDNGQHVFLRCCTAYRRLLVRLGVEADTVLQERLDVPVVAEDGRVFHFRRSELRAPLQLGPAIARFPFLSVRDRVGIARAAHHLSRLDPADPSLDERAFADWLEDHGQSEEAIEGLWDLIVLPTVNLPSREASLLLAAKVFQTGLLESVDSGDIGYAGIPLQHLHGDAGERALSEARSSLQLRTRAERIEPAGDGLAVHAGGDALPADAVVLAVPHDNAARLLPDGALATRDRLPELGASPIVNLHVVYDRPIMDLPFAAGNRSPVQYVFDRTESSGLGKGQYLAVSLSGATRHADRKVDELRAEFLPALARLFPGARNASVESFFVTREQRATFRQAPGTRALRPGPRTRIPGLYLAGAWTDTGWPATMEGAVRSGVRAAHEALSQVGAREKVVA
jgi:squalene-associated FAD-dependent desaturase